MRSAPARSTSLERALPNLKSLQTDMEHFHVSGHAFGTNLMPNLSNLTIYNRDLGSMKDVLQAAKTMLEVVEFTRMQLGKTLVFACSRLRKISLVQIASLSELTLWAPELRILTAEECPALLKIRLLEDFKNNKANLLSDYSAPPLDIGLKLRSKQTVTVVLGGRPQVSVIGRTMRGGEWIENDAAVVVE